MVVDGTGMCSFIRGKRIRVAEILPNSEYGVIYYAVNVLDSCRGKYLRAHNYGANYSNLERKRRSSAVLSQIPCPTRVFVLTISCSPVVV